MATGTVEVLWRVDSSTFFIDANFEVLTSCVGRVDVSFLFASFHQEIFGDRLYVVANKADHLNASDVERIQDKAVQRLEDYGITPAPRFFTVSARLEAARRAPRDEYRQRTKRRVRELCDAGFDALRVALYEFEAAHCAPEGAATFEDWVRSPLATSFIATQEGVPA